MKKKVLSLLLTLAMIMTMLPMEVIAEELPEEDNPVIEELTEAGEAETGLMQDESGVYQINGSEDWALFCEMLAEGYSFDGETVSLKTSVSLSKPADAFNGILLGNGNTISLTIDESNSDIGAFKSTKGAVIKDLYVEGSVKGNDNVGGIVGTASDTTFENCIANVTVQAQGANAGGIAGYAVGQSAFSNCVNNGNISGKGNVDGIVGYAEDSVQVDQCDNTGVIEIIEEEPAGGTPDMVESTEAEKLTIDGLGTNVEVKYIDENTVSITGTCTFENSFENDNQLNVEGNATIFLPEGETVTYNEGIRVGTGSTLRIIGTGTLIAKGKKYGAAIGGNHSDRVGTIIIEGGNIQATGGENGAGIGGGWGGNGGNVIISGGTVTANGGAFGAGIGGGGGGKGGSFTITGGTVTAIGGEESAGIGGGANSNGGNVIISGGTVTANGGKNAAGIGGGALYGSGGNVKINGGTVTATGGSGAPGIGGGRGSGNRGTLEVPKNLVRIYVNDGKEPVSQYNWENRVRIIFVGGYIDKSTINITGFNTIKSDLQNDNRLNVQESATIVLPKGMTLTLPQGIHVGPGSTLRIEGAGTLIVRGENECAGIGGDNNESTGTITIDSSNIQATGGTNAAGIGGGTSGNGGNITIIGSDVMVTGGENAAGIGGGNGGSGGNITIIGSTVTTNGGENAAGIGGGIGGSGSNTTIDDSTVYAAGGGNASAIGRGWSGGTMGTFQVRDGLSVFDLRNEDAPIRIIDPTPEKLDGITKITIQKTIVLPQIAEGLTYNGKRQNGCINADQQHMTLSGTTSSVGAGTYTFTATPEKGYSWEDGTTEGKTFTWQIASKDVSGTRSPVTQNISAGIGKFTAPGDFRDAETNQNIPGTLAYTYGGKQMTQEQVEEELSKLRAGESGSFDWTYAASGNFTGTIKGSIRYVIRRGIEFTVGGKPADATNAVTIKKNPVYGDDWSQIVTIRSNAITASLNGVKGTGRYTLNVTGKPNAGEQEYIVRFTGRFGSASYTNVTVFSGTVNIAKADYAGVTKTASTEVEFKKGKTVEIALPDIPQSTDYGTPHKTKESDPFTVSEVNNGKVVLTMTEDAEDVDAAKPMTFVVPVITDGNHNGYDITVTVNRTAIFVIGPNTEDLTGICTIESNIQNRNRLNVKGSATIILPEGMTLDLTEGICVGPGTTLRIMGSGTLIAKGDRQNDSAIGGNGQIGGGTGTIIIDGGTIRATGAAYGAGIGGSSGVSGGNITINGGTVEACGGMRAAGIGGGFFGNGGNVTINGGIVTATGGELAPAIGGGRSSRNNGTLKVIEDRSLIYVNDGKEPVSRYNLESKVRIVCTEEMYINENTVNITGACTFSREIRSSKRLNVQGSATITLPEGMTQRIYEGIHVGPGSTLRIEGSGRLIIDRVLNKDAGIGGNDNESAGTIIIDGGTIEVRAVAFAAGIGGGASGNGGTIIINGGTVTVNGGMLAAGIGGGIGGSGGDVTISGGMVTAKTKYEGAGIGGGERGNGGNITITGGTVTASGGEFGAGIGGGWHGNGGDVKIETANVTATGGDHAVGIGRGWQGNLMGTFKIGDGVSVFDMSDEESPVLITDPTPEKLDLIAKVTIMETIAIPQAAEGLTYNGKKQNGCVNVDQPHVIFGGTTSAVNVGTYTFTATPEAGYYWTDGTTEKRTFTWRIAPKNVSGTRLPVTQNILEGIGKFTAPSIYDAETDQNIPGTFIYTYDGKKMTQEQVEKELAKLRAGTPGSFDWTYIARGNFTGIIKGSIRYIIRGIEFMVDGKPADATNAVIIKQNPTYGDDWSQIVTIKSGAITASLNGVKGTGRYTLNVTGKPNAGEQEYSVMFSGRIGEHTYNNVTVFSGTVKIFLPGENEIDVTVKGTRERLSRFLPIRGYQMSIRVKTTDTRIIKVEYSKLGLFYTIGEKMTSLLPITHFYIRVTEANGTRHIYEYRNGNVTEQR